MILFKFYLELTLDGKDFSETVYEKLKRSFRTASSNPNYDEAIYAKWTGIEKNYGKLFAGDQLVAHANVKGDDYYLMLLSNKYDINENTITLFLFAVSENRNISLVINRILKDVHSKLLGCKAKPVFDNGLAIYPYSAADRDMVEGIQINANFKESYFQQYEKIVFWIVFGLSSILALIHSYRKQTGGDFVSILIEFYCGGFFYCLIEFLFKYLIPRFFSNRRYHVEIGDATNFLEEVLMPYAEENDIDSLNTPNT